MFSFFSYLYKILHDEWNYHPQYYQESLNHFEYPP